MSVIFHNIMSMNAQRALAKNTNAQSKTLEKLSSGLKVNRAADDAAGLSISEKMRSQIASLNRETANEQDAVSFIQTAEGALDEVSSMLVRMKELAVQKGDVAVDATDDLPNIEAEMQELSSAIDDIIDKTTFNGKNINTQQTGTCADASTYAVGADMSALGGLDSGSTSSEIDAAINSVNSVRSTLGAQQNKFERSINNKKCTVENLQSAESRIRDTDMASEMSEFNKLSILVQASTSMIAQANSAPQTVLSLLQ